VAKRKAEDDAAAAAKKAEQTAHKNEARHP